MAVAGRTKIGPTLGLIGSILLTIAGFLAFGTLGIIDTELVALGLTWIEIGFDPFLLILRGLITLLVGLLGLTGAILALYGKEIGGNILLVVGVGAIFGSFFPMAALALGPTLLPITIVFPFIYVESFLILIGGIIE
jgi:hypothetical protein